MLVFRNFEYFIAIAASGSLTKAAEQLYVSQPSLSQYLKRLESSLGVELFDHNTSPLRLTYIGERYYQYVKQVKQLDENVQKEFQDIENQTSGKLRLGIALWRGASLLPDIFPAFHQKYPDIRLVLTEGRSVQLEAALMNDKIDIAVINIPRTLNYGKLTCEIICEEQILLAAPTQHPYVQKLLQDCRIISGHPVAPLDILQHMPLIPTKSGQNLTHEVMYALGKHHIEPDILLETGNLTTAINLVSQGMGCTFVPGAGAKVCQHPGTVTYFTADVQDLVWDLGVVYRKDAYLSNLARVFIDSMKQQLSTGNAEL
jgi:DNA-binding transcriptional LysR family regulator